MKTWAVVHDLRPFGYRIYSTHRWRRIAQWKAGFNRYLSVMPVSKARAYNQRTEDMAEFDKELALFVQRKSESAS